MEELYHNDMFFIQSVCAQTLLIILHRNFVQKTLKVHILCLFCWNTVEKVKVFVNKQSFATGQ